MICDHVSVFIFVFLVGLVLLSLILCLFAVFDVSFFRRLACLGFSTVCVACSIRFVKTLFCVCLMCLVFVPSFSLPGVFNKLRSLFNCCFMKALIFECCLSFVACLGFSTVCLAFFYSRFVKVIAFLL